MTHSNTIQRWQKTYDLPKLKARYEAGESLLQLSEAYHVSPSKIHNILVALGVPRRPKGRPKGAPKAPRAPQPFKGGARSHSAQLTADIVCDMRRRYAAGETLAAIGGDVGVTAEGARKAVYGITWSHVPGAVGVNRVKGRSFPDRRRFTDEEGADIIRRYQSDRTVTLKSLAQEHGVAVETIRRIFNQAGAAIDERSSRNSKAAAKLTVQDVRDIRQALAAGSEQQVLADFYGVTDGAISHIATRRTWKDVA